MTGENSSYDPTTLEASRSLVNYHRWVVGKIAHLIRGRTLEFGAGTGTVSSLLTTRASELVLAERAPNLCRILEARFIRHPDVSIWCGELEDLCDSEAGTFLTIVSFNVLEHIEDDLAALCLARELLESGGLLVLFVPSLPALYGVVDAHVGHRRRYTKKSLSGLVRTAGFQIERLEYVDLVGIVPWFLVGRVFRRASFGEKSGALHLYDRLIVPATKIVDRVTGPPVGKNLLVVGRRTDA